MKRNKNRVSQKNSNNSEANLSFEEKLWAAAGKLRGHMDPAEIESDPL